MNDSPSSLPSSRCSFSGCPQWTSARRPAGQPWVPLVGSGKNPLGDWEILLSGTEVVRSWFAGGLIEDVVLAINLTATTPAWP